MTFNLCTDLARSDHIMIDAYTRRPRLQISRGEPRLSDPDGGKKRILDMIIKY